MREQIRDADFKFALFLVTRHQPYRSSALRIKQRQSIILQRLVLYPMMYREESRTVDKDACHVAVAVVWCFFAQFQSLVEALTDLYRPSVL
jgi:hypothetical protein